MAASSSDLSGDRFRPPKKRQQKAQEPVSRAEKPKDVPFLVIVTEEAKKAFQDLPRNVQDAMHQIMDRLMAWPEVSGVRSLFGKGYAANKFRMKTWDWRIEFLVDMPARTITVTRIGHRDSFYDEYHRGRR